MTSVGTVLSYPIPAYQNLPIEPQFYQPSRFVISAINEGLITTVTTTVDTNYVVGQQVRLLIPPAYGAYGLNNQFGLVIDLPATNQVTILINSTYMDPFIPSPTIPNGGDTTLPQIVAIGDTNSGQVNLGRNNNLTYIPGSFIDISPN